MYNSSRCQFQHLNPHMRDTLCWRMSAANIGPRLFQQKRTASYQKPIPRSNSKSSTLLRLSGKRTYMIARGRSLRAMN